jgi:aldose 1-epimerase
MMNLSLTMSNAAYDRNSLPPEGLRRFVGICGFALAAVATALLSGCSEPGEVPVADAEGVLSERVTTSPFGTLSDGRAVTAYTLRNAGGMEVVAIDYGAIITHVRVPDTAGNFGDVALGFDILDGYLSDPPYFGAIVGRYGNRIAAGRFTLDGVEYELATNNGRNHLHGGNVGFDKVLWDVEIIEPGQDEEGGPASTLRMTYVSPDGEEGYPGTLTTRVTYTLSDDNALAIQYELTTDAPTPVNVTQHTYFNLAASGDVLGHELILSADHFTPVDATLIPTGAIAPVAGTPFDFTTAKPIGRDIDADDQQLVFGGGYDHNFVLNRDVVADAAGRALVLAAEVFDPGSGRVLEVLTTEPGVQFYSGNFLDGTITGKNGEPYESRSGFCLETQHYPDSPNQRSFPSTILRPGETYHSRTEFRFSIR